MRLSRSKRGTVVSRPFVSVRSNRKESGRSSELASGNFVFMTGGDAMQTRKITRRQFLRISAVGGASFIVVACTQATPPAATQVPGATLAPGATQAPAATAAGAESPRGFREPPLLADRGACGNFPPIDQRL